MLQSIRDHTQGWIAGIIISILILSFALWGVHSYLVGGGGSAIVASVNGVDISKGELAVSYERLHRQLQMQNNSNAQLPENAELDLKKRALQALINIQVLKQASLAQKYRISSNQTVSFLESMPEFQVNGRFSQTRFQKILEVTLYSVGDFLELIKTSLLIDQPRLGLIFTSFALPNEITDTMALVNQERDIQYLVLTLDAISKQPIQIPEDKIKAYYSQHQDEFKTPEQVTIAYLELTVDNLASRIHPSDDELKKFYTENSSSYARPMEWKLESIIVPVAENATDKEIVLAQNKANEIVQQAKQGKEFLTLTKASPTAKTDVKLQGWVTLAQVPNDLQKIISGLTKGMVSSPVQTHKGMLIVKAVDVKAPVAQSFEQVKDKLKEVYIHQQAEEKFVEMREKLANLTYEHPDSLEPAAKALDIPVKISDVFTKDKGGKDITSNNKIRDAALSNDVLNLGNNSDVIQINGNDAVVIRIKTHTPAALLTLEAVEKQITGKLKAIEVDSRVAQLANEISQKLQNGTAPDQVAHQYNLTWNNPGFIARRANKINSAILEKAFEMPKPVDNNKASYAATKIPNGYAVIAVKAVRNNVNNADHKQYQVFAEQVQNTQGLMEYELYKESLMRQAKIELEN